MENKKEEGQNVQLGNYFVTLVLYKEVWGV